MSKDFEDGTMQTCTVADLLLALARCKPDDLVLISSTMVDSDGDIHLHGVAQTIVMASGDKSLLVISVGSDTVNLHTVRDPDCAVVDHRGSTDTPQ